jgi:hypothetical protein
LDLWDAKLGSASGVVDIYRIDSASAVLALFLQAVEPAALKTFSMLSSFSVSDSD